MPCCRSSTIFHFCSTRVCDQMPPVLRLRELPLKWRRPHTHIQGRTASRDSSGGKNVRRPGLRSSEPSGFRSNARPGLQVSCRRPQRERTRGVQEGTAASTLSTTHPESVAESFLNIGNVVRRQDTSRARVQVVEPLVGDLRVAQVFGSCHLLPSVRSVSRESCAWSCGALSRLYRDADKSMSSLSSSCDAEPGCSTDAMVGFATLGPCNPPTDCCQASSAA